MITFAQIYEALTDQPPPEGTTQFRVTPWVMHSKEVQPQGGFVARPGATAVSQDGHHYIADALARGAAVVIAQRDRISPGSLGENVQVIDLENPDVTLLRPPVVYLGTDSLEEIQRLARWWRQQAQPGLRVVGITGSVGKTTTKELVAAVLSTSFRTWKSRGNYNSDVGLPMSLLDMPLDTERAVVEMGMTRQGEIAELGAIVRPQLGVVTNIGPAHMMQLGSLDAIAAAKQELVEGLPADGIAILNADDPRVMAMSAHTPARVMTFGMHPENSVWADRLTSMGLDGISFRFHHGQDTVYAHLPLLGRHSVHGSLAAAAVGLSQGMSWGEIIAGLKSMADLDVLRVLVVDGINGSTLIDDTYNASPDSMMAALNLLNDLDGRKIAVLGDMKELGHYSDEGHRLVARRAGNVADQLITLGEYAELMASEARIAGMEASAVYAARRPSDANEWLRNLLQPDDIVLFKASRAMRLDELVSALSVPTEDV